MTEIHVTKHVVISLENKMAISLLPGIRNVPDNVMGTDAFKALRFRDAEELSPFERTVAERDTLHYDNTGLIFNIPQTDVTTAGAVDARAHVMGDFSTKTHPRHEAMEAEAAERENRRKGSPVEQRAAGAGEPSEPPQLSPPPEPPSSPPEPPQPGPFAGTGKSKGGVA